MLPFGEVVFTMETTEQQKSIQKDWRRTARGRNKNNRNGSVTHAGGEPDYGRTMRALRFHTVVRGIERVFPCREEKTPNEFLFEVPETRNDEKYDLKKQKIIPDL